ncbi:MAG: phosphoribosylformylglycinamidine cyclo-ligase, partial [Candidatus Binatia bacterium]
TKPALVSSTDGVGTKLLVANLAGRHDTIGIDLVAMNVNDVLTSGARPLFFLDYISAGDLASVECDHLIDGIVRGCSLAGVSLVGGETAEMPGFYASGAYDLAGFCVGVCEQAEIVDGSKVRPGDVIVGLHSSGLHSNGYSLAREVLGVSTSASLRRFRGRLGRPLGEELLEPTIIYAKPVLACLKKYRVSAMAHITGGGLPGNLVRVLPAGIGAVISRSELPSLPIFELIQDLGDLEDKEMARTFNCGIGFALVVGPLVARRVATFFRRRGQPVSIIGEIVKGKRVVRYRN